MSQNGHPANILAAICILRRTRFELNGPVTLAAFEMADRLVTALTTCNEEGLKSVIVDLIAILDQMTDRTGGMILSVVIDLLENK